MKDFKFKLPMLLSDEKVTFLKLDVLIFTEASIFPLLEKDTRVFDNLIILSLGLNLRL